jgi:gliding motility-associated-like protein
LTTDNASGNSWYKDGVLIAGFTGSGYVASASGVYTVQHTNISGCISGLSAPVNVTINAVPVVAAISGTQQICVGGSTQFSNTTAGGTWISTNTGIATVDGTGMVVGIASGTANISYSVSNASGCTVTVTRAVTVNSLPVGAVLTAGSATAFCAPGSVTLNSSVSSGNQWYKDGIAIVGATGNSYTASATGTYTVITSNGSGCVSQESDGIDVTANATPTVPSIKAVKSTSFCEGGSVKLSTSNQSGNSWYKDGIIIPGVTGSSYTATASGVYTVQVSNTAGCVSGTSAGLTVTVNALPIVQALTGTQTVCEGSVTNFASATGSGVWSSSNGNIASVNTVGQVTGLAVGTATISYAVSNASGCITVVTRDVTVTALPVKPTVSSNSASSFCLPGTALLSSSAATGNQWYLNGNLITGATASTYTANQTGTYTVVTTAGGCASAQSDGWDITANASPAQPSLKAIKNTVFCEGGTVKISTDYGSGNTWYRDAVILPGVTGSFYNATVSGNYTVQHTNLNGCTSILSPVVLVTVNPLPVVPAITGVQEICVGNSTVLSNTLSGGTWSSTNTAIATISANGTVTGIAAGTANIMYTVANASGCNSSVLSSIAVNALPSVSTIQGGSLICVGDSTLFSNQTQTGIWTSSNTNIAVVNANGMVKALSAGTVVISYTVSNGNGCNTTVNKSLTVNPLPSIPTITANGPLDFCVGSSVTLSSNATTSIIWYRDGLLLDTAINTKTIQAQLPGTYSSRNFNTYCIGALSNAIVVTNKPITKLDSIVGPNQICLNGSINLSNSIISGVWTSSNPNIATVDAQGLVTAKAIGTVIISYAASSSGNCPATITKSIVVNGLPATPLTTATGATAFCQGGSVLLTSSSNANTVWYRDGVFIDTAFQSQTLLTGQSGTYTALVFDNNFCLSGLSSPINVAVTIPPAQPVISTTNSTTFCIPGSALLTSTVATGNQWYLNGSPIIGARGVTYSAAVSGSYTVIASQAGCVSAESDLIEISANATASIPSLKAAKSATVCDGNAVKLITGSASGNEWFKNGVLIPGVTGNSYTTTESGLYTVRSNNVTGCVSGTSQPITVAILPQINIAPITGANSLCVNTATLFSSTTAGAIWSSNDTLTATVNSQGLVTALRPGVATISYTLINAGGCVSKATKDILVNNLPIVPKITVNGSTSFCSPGSVQLNSSFLAGNQWYLNGIAITGATGASYTATASGSYAVGSTANGCSSTLSNAIDVHASLAPAVPVLRAVKGLSACQGASVQLVTASSGTNFWYKDGVLIDGVNGNQYNAVASGSYTVQTSNLAACVSGVSAALTVTIQPLPVLAALTGNQQICLNGTTTLSSSNAGGIWSSDNSPVAKVSNTGLVSGLALGSANIQYTLTGTNGCSTTTTRTVTVNPLPVVVAITGSNAVCVNAKTSFATLTSNGVWSSLNTSIATVNASTGEVTGIAAGTTTIRYTVTNNSGCSTIVSKDIQVNPLPLVTANASATTVSKGRDITLTATGTGTFAWTPIQNISNVNAASTLTRVTEKTTYTVILTSALGCLNTASVTVDVVEDLYVEPTIVFTPNGDGFNDKFVIKNLDQYPNNRLQVFDRTGKVLFEQNNYANNWDGTVNGKLLTKDTYLYILTIKGQIVKKGTVTLVR